MFSSGRVCIRRSPLDSISGPWSHKEQTLPVGSLLWALTLAHLG